MTASTTPRLTVKGLSKTYPGTRALSDVDLTLERGQVHALVGGNGSGKSTLIKILAGVQSSDHGGRITVGPDSMDADRWNARHAEASGLRFVHQDLGLFGTMTVAENLAIGTRLTGSRAAYMSTKNLNMWARGVLETFEIEAEPETSVAALSASNRATIAIARALNGLSNDEQSAILVLDEPTAALPAHEVNSLLTAIQRYADTGHSVLYVSHRLDEVHTLADQITCLRDGSVIHSGPATSLARRDLIELIAGRSVSDVYPQPPAITGAERSLVVQTLTAGRVQDLSLVAAAGEVVGLAGLSGGGPSDILKALFGLSPGPHPELSIRDEQISPTSARAAIAQGIAYIPPNRAIEASFPTMTVAENMSGGDVGRHWRGLHINSSLESAASVELMDTFAIKADSPSTPMSALSGGNQQKVVLARWLQNRPRLLLLDEPTQGVDVGARTDIWELVFGATIEGTIVFVASSDFAELSHVCHRVIVIRDGTPVNVLSGSELTEKNITSSLYEKELSA